MGIIKPITDWVDVELLPSVDCYIDCYLPELDADHKTSMYVQKQVGYKVQAHERIGSYGLDG